jgi:lipopolysaccharide/colanic/teichoic acid biosynthesis glycosyltransferase
VTAHLDAVPGSGACSTSAPARLDTPLRRGVDVVAAVFGLVLSFPVLVVVALLVCLDSPGPPFFRQERVGRGARAFRIVKFRTMVADAANRGPSVSGHADPRVTRVGRVLRATKLDELPQLVNLLTGTVTLIGPRPEVPRFVAHYTEEERQLLAGRPGITGPGQLYFTTDQAAMLDGAQDPDECYVTRQLHPKLAIDLAYLRERSLRTDLAVLVATVAACLPAHRLLNPSRQR